LIKKYFFFLNSGPAAVISQCTKSIFEKILINDTQATATLRTGAVPRTDKSARFRMSFWCKFMSTPNVADEADPTRFFLELALHRQRLDGIGLPSKYLWGSNSTDYDSIEPTEWNEVTLEFTESEQFRLMFFAHHNDKCDPEILIHLDSVVVETGKFNIASIVR
jgi:hypothetical protein